jgi:hypothetical protein
VVGAGGTIGTFGTELDSVVGFGAGFAAGFEPKNDRMSAPGFGACFDMSAMREQQNLAEKRFGAK